MAKVTFIQPSGVTYVGDWYQGKYHGRGELTSPTTGYSFIGRFSAGKINGSGALVYPMGRGIPETGTRTTA